MGRGILLFFSPSLINRNGTLSLITEKILLSNTNQHAIFVINHRWLLIAGIINLISGTRTISTFEIEYV